MLSNPIREWYHTKVDIPYGNLGSLIDWCKRNCNSDWHFTESTDIVEQFNQGAWQFYFKEEKDYINFVVWQK
jgi:hypothetical protein